MSQLTIQFDTFSLEEKDGIVEFTAESLEPGKYNGINITLEELEKAAASWEGKDVLLGHSDTIVGEIKYSTVENGKLIQKGTLDDPRSITLIQKGKLKPSIGADNGILFKEGELYAVGIQGDHLALVRRPACKQCTIKVAMSEQEKKEYFPGNNKSPESSINFIKSFTPDSGIGEVTMETEELKQKLEASEAERDELKLKLEAADKELNMYRQRDRLELARKVVDAEIKLNKTTKDKHPDRVEELGKLEMSDLKDQYTVLLEELAAKAQSGQGRLPTGGDPGSITLEKKLEKEITELHDGMNNMVVV